MRVRIPCITAVPIASKSGRGSTDFADIAPAPAAALAEPPAVPSPALAAGRGPPPIPAASEGTLRATTVVVGIPALAPGARGGSPPAPLPFAVAPATELEAERSGPTKKKRSVASHI